LTCVHDLFKFYPQIEHLKDIPGANLEVVLPLQQ
jgi:hypothetical protein